MLVFVVTGPDINYRDRAIAREGQALRERIPKLVRKTGDWVYWEQA